MSSKVVGVSISELELNVEELDSDMMVSLLDPELNSLLDSRADELSGGVFTADELLFCEEMLLLDSRSLELSGCSSISDEKYSLDDSSGDKKLDDAPASCWGSGSVPKHPARSVMEHNVTICFLM